MPKPKNAMEIYKLLEGSNCKKCKENTCLAFAGAVFRGQRKLSECPMLDEVVLARYGESAKEGGGKNLEDDREDALRQMKAEIAKVDLAAVAERLGGTYSGGKLTLKVLGKNFSVDDQGNLSADIHINPWIAGPFMDYVIRGKGADVTGKWVGMRDLKEGQEWGHFFFKRCEEPMKRVADIFTDLFDTMATLFQGKTDDPAFDADISVVLYPLPKVPLAICYWPPEDGMESSLNVFFDESVDTNLSMGSIYTLGVGLTQMFERLAIRHGFKVSLSG